MSIVSVSELDLFGKPSVQTSIEHTTEKDHYPISSMIESGPLEFTITGSGDEYLDLSSAYLHVTASISVGGVTNPTDDDKVAPVNNWVQSLFSQVDVSLNGKMVSSSSNTYAYRAYIETLLTFGKAYKKTYLTNSMWYKDTAGHMNDLGDENVGTTKRSNLTAHGKKVDMIGYIHDDVFRQTRLLPPGVTVKVRFVRATEQFSLISTRAGYKTEISSAILYVKKCKVNPEVCLALASVHKQNNMYFPIKRVDCKVFTIPAGSLSAFKEGIISGQLPKKIVVGCVRNTAYSGVYNENPFNFEHFNLSNIAVHIDGQSDTVPSLDPDFTNSLYLRCFHSMFGGAGKVNTDEDLDVSRTEYDKGYTLYGFNLATDHDQVFEVTKRGSVRIDLKFDVALAHTINVIVYAEYENVIQIDSARNVLLDYSN